MYTRHQVPLLSPNDLQENKPHEILLGGKRICLLKRGDKIAAFSANCPHASGNLCDGWVDARGNIVCPVHGYRFDPANGRNTSGEGYKLFTYPVEINDNEIYVSLLS